MYSPVIANFLLLLFLLSSLPITFTTATQHPPTAHHVSSRQSPTIPPPESCLDYEITANRSTIGANSTYRSAFLQKSNTGTIYNARMLDAAIKKLPALTTDQDLNRLCGNWTEIALKGAEANFSMGVVAQFSTVGLPVGIEAGPEVVGIVGGIAVLMSMVWVFG